VRTNVDTIHRARVLLDGIEELWRARVDRIDDLLATEKRTTGDHKLPTIPLPGLRNTWATIALQVGIHPRVVQEWLDHSNIAITLQTHSHVLPTMHDDAATSVAAHAASLRWTSVIRLATLMYGHRRRAGRSEDGPCSSSVCTYRPCWSNAESNAGGVR